MTINTKNIQSKIITRKVVLSFIYKHLSFVKGVIHGISSVDDFFFHDEKKNVVVHQYIETIFSSGDQNDQNVKREYDKKKFMQSVKEFFSLLHTQLGKEYIIEQLHYIHTQFYSYKSDIPVDYSFAYGIIKSCIDNNEEFITKIDVHTKSFGVERMHIVDQSVFFLGLAEISIGETPKEVILNEMIELGKRFGGNNSGKLINGILHKLCL